MNTHVIPECYYYLRLALTYTKANAKNAVSLAEAKAEAEAMKRKRMLPEVRAKAEAEQQATIDKLEQSAKITTDLSRAYIIRSMRAAQRRLSSDYPGERYAARVALRMLIEPCKKFGVPHPTNAKEVWTPDIADEVEALKVVISSVQVRAENEREKEYMTWIQQTTESDAEEGIVEGPVAKCTGDVEAFHSAALTVIAAGVCPYNFEAASALEDSITEYEMKYSLIGIDGEILAKYKANPTALAGEPLSSAVVGCRAADMLIRHQLTGEQQAIMLEVLARMPRPKKDIKDIRVDTPDIAVSLTEQDVSTIAQVVYGRNRADRRDKLYADLQGMAKAMEYDYLDAAGNVVHRKGQLCHTVVDTNKKTGAFIGMAVHISPAFGLLAKSKYWTAYLEEYHRQRIAANGDEFSTLYLAMMKHFDAISQAQAHGKRMKVEVRFSAVFGQRPDKSNRGKYVGYTRRINRAEAVAPTVTQAVGAASFRVMKHAGERIGIAFDFTPSEVDTAELAARVNAIEQKVDQQKSEQKRGRGRPRKMSV